ncbi:AraC family ligand binding domain-containing protein, partial [Salmonella enterica subsp. enterica serovar Kentucky]|nr:AraC family ligand binding domain-containing protein [Salmonella enterica subsp. enterica serovar Kentucky]
RPGDILLFPPGEIHHYGRHPDASEWYHQWVYFRPRAYWQEWLNSQGIDERDVNSERLRKSVGVERTLAEDIHEWSDCEAIIEHLY